MSNSSKTHSGGLRTECEKWLGRFHICRRFWNRTMGNKHCNLFASFQYTSIRLMSHLLHGPYGTPSVIEREVEHGATFTFSITPRSRSSMMSRTHPTPSCLLKHGETTRSPTKTCSSCNNLEALPINLRSNHAIITSSANASGPSCSLAITNTIKARFGYQESLRTAESTREQKLDHFWVGTC